MATFLSKLFGTSKATKSSKTTRRSYQLGLEALEKRLTPATPGLTKRAFIDFDGAAISGAQMLLGGWVGEGDTSVNGFRRLFTAANPLLDVNGNGVVNGTDADEVIQRIMDKVRQDFSPYNIDVRVADFAVNAGAMLDPILGDVFVIVSDGGNVLDNQPALGLAPVDLGNLRDDIAFVFGGSIADGTGMNNVEGGSLARFINLTAIAISHEMGHTFGLEHAPHNDATDVVLPHHLMGAPGAAGDFRDVNHDMVFADVAFATEAGMQNAHQILSNDFVLGPSANSWIAMLKPGELTITGSTRSDNISVRQVSLLRWEVTRGSTVTRVERTNIQGINSFSPFETVATRINIVARDGDDTINLSGMTDHKYFAHVDGGEGKDVLIGGVGDDVFLGGNGNDSITGGGGDDELHGGGDDDTLRGGSGDDHLFGQDGTDRLFGDADNDFLDGGAELLKNRDELTGGTGFDTLVQHQGWFGLWDQDQLMDVAEALLRR